MSKYVSTTGGPVKSHTSKNRREKLAYTARRLVDLVGDDIRLDWVERIVLTRDWVVAVCTDGSECPIIEYREWGCDRARL
jgi:hypothetical protein